MIRIKLLFVIFLSVLAVSCNKSSAIQPLIDKSKLEENKLLVVLFNDIGSCDKCYLQAMQTINYGLDALEKAKYDIYRIRTIASLTVTRKKETALFVKKFGWQSPVYADISGSLRQKLQIGDDVILGLFNYSGELLYSLKSSNEVKEKEIKRFAQTIYNYKE